MSNDLISRKLVFADDIHRYIKAQINPYGKPFEGSAYEFGLKVMKYIENMSAAYDVDKVVEQLEHLDLDGIRMKEDGKHYLIKQEEAIEIVKAGGTDEN